MPKCGIVVMSEIASCIVTDGQKCGILVILEFLHVWFSQCPNAELSSGLKVLLALLRTVQMRNCRHVWKCLLHCVLIRASKCKSVVNVNAEIASCFVQSLPKCGFVVRSEIASCFLFRVSKCGIVVMFWNRWLHCFVTGDPECRPFWYCFLFCSVDANMWSRLQFWNCFLLCYRRSKMRRRRHFGTLFLFCPLNAKMQNCRHAWNCLVLCPTNVQMRNCRNAWNCLLHCFVTGGPECKSVVNSDVASYFVQPMPKCEAAFNSEVAYCFVTGGPTNVILVV